MVLGDDVVVVVACVLADLELVFFLVGLGGRSGGDHLGD